MNILLTSAGRRSYLIKYFKSALRGKGLVHASNSEYTIALQDADRYFIAPLIYKEDYIEQVIAYCLKNDIKAIVSVFDIDLLVLSKAKQYFEAQGIRLLVSSEEVVEICNDKWKTYEFLQENGFCTPKTYKDLPTVLAAIRRHEITYPVIIKPRWGMASMAIYIADNEDELRVLYKKSLSQISTSYLQYESARTPDEPVLIQEILTGQEYGLDVINDFGGNFVCVLPKSKLRMRAGETDLGQTVSSDRFNLVAKKMSSVLRHEIILSVDCFDVKGEIFILEMNCRISGHYPLSQLAGANLPKQIISWLEGGCTDMNNFRFEEGIYVTKDLNPVVLNLPKFLDD